MSLGNALEVHARPEPRPFVLRIAALAALAASLGDLLLLLAANAMRPELSVPAPPAVLLLVGALLGAVAIPFYALGYAGIAAHVTAPATAWTIRAAGFAGAIVGAVVHLRTAMLIHTGRGSAQPAASPLQEIFADPVLVWLWAAATASMVTASMAFTLAVMRGQIGLDSRARLLNPVVLTLALSLAGSMSTYGQAFLVPMSPNVAHWLWFDVMSRRLRARIGNTPW
ncbi:MAG TPA: DUF6796 family protein [Candidatus Binatia bacterium]|nr:DUF6796 family protein [Candidatus Binatia bacterium]